MRLAKKFVSVMAIVSITACPLFSVGCADQAAPAKPTTAKPAEGAKAASADGKATKQKKKAASDAAESGSTTGGGVKPPVK